ncbi:MAG: carboxypeptidase-like regulatory domain-containing protein [Candidatus Sulfotelmatobacter sp.]
MHHLRPARRSRFENGMYNFGVNMADQSRGSIFGSNLRFGLAILCSLSCIAICERRLVAQSTGAATGHVTGQVFCSDTNGPARLASVTLQPVPAAKVKNNEGTWIENSNAEPTPSVMTDLGGTFNIEHVKPGLYYVIAELPGYLNSTSEFTEEELKHPTPEVLEEMEQNFPRINVDAAQTARIVVQLQRGAAVSGAVSYDDGTPAAGVTIELLHKQNDGRWRADIPGTVRRMLFGSKTDDLGHFRISGLSTGEVIVKCTVRQVSMLIQPRSLMGPPLSVSIFDEQKLDIYSGGVFRDKDAKPIKLTAGTEITDADIVIPLAGR